MSNKVKTDIKKNIKLYYYVLNVTYIDENNVKSTKATGLYTSKSASSMAWANLQYQCDMNGAGTAFLTQFSVNSPANLHAREEPLKN